MSHQTRERGREEERKRGREEERKRGREEERKKRERERARARANLILSLYREHAGYGWVAYTSPLGATEALKLQGTHPQTSSV